MSNDACLLTQYTCAHILCYEEDTIKNVTLSMDDALLKAVRAYASTHRTSLNQLIRDLLSQLVRPQKTSAIQTMFSLMDQAKIRSDGYVWNRNDGYDV